MASVLYNGMLAPIVPLSITGAIWYQGESHEKLAAPYYNLLPAMISDWRRLFGQGDFPFYIVSLPVYRHRSEAPVDDGWTGVREAQSLAAKNVPHSCLAVTVDTGNPDNVHPIDKREPGERLALCALGEHSGKDVVYSGPTLKSVERLLSLRLRYPIRKRSATPGRRIPRRRSSTARVCPRRRSVPTTGPALCRRYGDRVSPVRCGQPL